VKGFSSCLVQSAEQRTAAVRTDVGRRWAKTATDLKMKDFKYMEIPGADHGTVITQSMPEIFKFFKDRTR
jgi:hypothetical protein